MATWSAGGGGALRLQCSGFAHSTAPDTTLIPYPDPHPPHAALPPLLLAKATHNLYPRVPPPPRLQAKETVGDPACTVAEVLAILYKMDETDEFEPPVD